MAEADFLRNHLAQKREEALEFAESEETTDLLASIDANIGLVARATTDLNSKVAKETAYAGSTKGRSSKAVKTTIGAPSSKTVKDVQIVKEFGPEQVAAMVQFAESQRSQSDLLSEQLKTLNTNLKDMVVITLKKSDERLEKIEKYLKPDTTHSKRKGDELLNKNKKKDKEKEKKKGRSLGQMIHDTLFGPEDDPDLDRGRDGDRRKSRRERARDRLRERRRRQRAGGRGRRGFARRAMGSIGDFGRDAADRAGSWWDKIKSKTGLGGSSTPGAKGSIQEGRPSSARNLFKRMPTSIKVGGALASLMAAKDVYDIVSSDDPNVDKTKELAKVAGGAAAGWGGASAGATAGAAMGSVVPGIGTVAGGIVGGIVGGMGGSMLGGHLAEAGVDTVRSGVDSASESIDKGWKYTKGVAQNAGEIAENGWNATKSAAGAVVDTGMAVGSGVAGLAVTAGSKGVDYARELASAGVAQGEKSAEYIRSAFNSSIIPGFNTTVSNFGRFSEGFQASAVGLVTKFGDTLDDWGKSVGKGLQSAKQKITENYNKAREQAQVAGQGAQEVGSSFTEGVKTTIGAAKQGWKEGGASGALRKGQEAGKTAMANVSDTLGRVTGSSSNRQYFDEAGNVETRQGGTRAWRNNNEGNLRYGEFAKANGAVGQDKDGFAIFANQEQGVKAKEKLLFENKNYKDKTLDAAISKYAPSTENDTALYQRKVREAAGVSGNTKMSDLTPDQRQKVLAEMKKHEGFKEGKTQYTDAKGNLIEKDKMQVAKSAFQGDKTGKTAPLAEKTQVASAEKVAPTAVGQPQTKTADEKVATKPEAKPAAPLATKEAAAKANSSKESPAGQSTTPKPSSKDVALASNALFSKEVKPTVDTTKVSLESSPDRQNVASSTRPSQPSPTVTATRRESVKPAPREDAAEIKVARKEAPPMVAPSTPEEVRPVTVANADQISPTVQQVAAPASEETTKNGGATTVPNLDSLPLQITDMGLVLLNIGHV